MSDEKPFSTLETNELIPGDTEDGPIVIRPAPTPDQLDAALAELAGLPGNELSPGIFGEAFAHGLTLGRHGKSVVVFKDGLPIRDVENGLTAEEREAVRRFLEMKARTN